MSRTCCDGGTSKAQEGHDVGQLDNTLGGGSVVLDGVFVGWRGVVCFVRCCVAFLVVFCVFLVFMFVVLVVYV